MREDKLIIQIPDDMEAKEQLFELLEDNDDLMLEVLEMILDVSDRDTIFREKVLDKIFETNYLARKVEGEMKEGEQIHGCCHSLVSR